jgi:hypothetical protein
MGNYSARFIALVQCDKSHRAKQTNSTSLSKQRARPIRPRPFFVVPGTTCSRNARFQECAVPGTVPGTACSRNTCVPGTCCSTCFSNVFHLFRQRVPLVQAVCSACFGRVFHLFWQGVPLVLAMCSWNSSSRACSWNSSSRACSWNSSSRACSWNSSSRACSSSSSVFLEQFQ